MLLFSFFLWHRLHQEVQFVAWNDEVEFVAGNDDLCFFFRGRRRRNFNNFFLKCEYPFVRFCLVSTSFILIESVFVGKFGTNFNPWILLWLSQTSIRLFVLCSKRIIAIKINDDRVILL